MTSSKDKHDSNKDKRGFASMDEDKQKEIASKGGKAAHKKGTAHEFDWEESSEAGKEAGKQSHGGGRKK